MLFSQQGFRLYYGDLPDSSDVLKRRIYMQPNIVDKIRVVVTEGKPNLLMKMDLIGMPTKRLYKSNPILDEKDFMHSKMGKSKLWYIIYKVF